MWHNETIVFITSLKRRLLGGKKKVRFEDIATDKAIPPYIVSAFKKKVDLYVQEEKPFGFRSTQHFEIVPQDIEQLLADSEKYLLKAAVFDAEEVEETLSEALIIRIDYLVKPVDTMRKRLFDNGAALQMNEAISRLRVFEKLMGYSESLISRCKKESLDELNQEKYTQITNQILHERFDDEPVKSVINEYTELLNHLAETKGEELKRIEGDIIRDFLTDRNCWGFRRAVEVEIELGKEDFGINDLEMTFKRYNAFKQEFSYHIETETQDIKQTDPEIEEPEDVEEPRSFTDQEEEQNETEAFKDDEKMPLTPVKNESLKEEQWDLEEIWEEKTKSDSKPAEEKINNQTPSKSMRIIRRETKENEQAEDIQEKEEYSGALKEAIDSKTEKAFLKKLFNNDKEAYTRLIDKLEEAESWRVAKILIDNELFKRDVDPFSREAIKLVDMIYSRFYPEEGVGAR